MRKPYVTPDLTKNDQEIPLPLGGGMNWSLLLENSLTNSKNLL
jgi:hypothetical protein